MKKIIWAILILIIVLLLYFDYQRGLVSPEVLNTLHSTTDYCEQDHSYDSWCMAIAERNLEKCEDFPEQKTFCELQIEFITDSCTTEECYALKFENASLCDDCTLVRAVNDKGVCDELEDPLNRQNCLDEVTWYKAVKENKQEICHGIIGGMNAPPCYASVNANTDSCTIIKKDRCSKTFDSELTKFKKEAAKNSWLPWHE